MTDKIKLITGGASPDLIAELIRKAWEQMPRHAELQRVKAHAQKVQYDALIEAGFTPAQALELVK